MKLFRFVFGSLFVCGVASGCIPGSRPTPHISADNSVIRVGQTTTVRMTVRNEDIAGGNLNLTFSAEGFFYSPNPNAPQAPDLGQKPAPYVPAKGTGGGFTAESSPDVFPIDTKVEIVSPSTTAPNVPSRIKVIQGVSESEVALEIKGKSPGKVVISGGFVWYANQFPQNFLRTAPATELDPKVTIEIVP